MKDWAKAEEIVRQMTGGRITPGSSSIEPDGTKEFLHPEVIEILETGVDEEKLPSISIEEEKQ